MAMASSQAHNPYQMLKAMLGSYGRLFEANKQSPPGSLGKLFLAIVKEFKLIDAGTHPNITRDGKSKAFMFDLLGGLVNKLLSEPREILGESEQIYYGSLCNIHGLPRDGVFPKYEMFCSKPFATEIALNIAANLKACASKLTGKSSISFSSRELPQLPLLERVMALVDERQVNLITDVTSVADFKRQVSVADKHIPNLPLFQIFCDHLDEIGNKVNPAILEAARESFDAFSKADLLGKHQEYLPLILRPYLSFYGEIRKHPACKAILAKLFKMEPVDFAALRFRHDVGTMTTTQVLDFLADETASMAQLPPCPLTDFLMQSGGQFFCAIACRQISPLVRLNKLVTIPIAGSAAPTADADQSVTKNSTRCIRSQASDYMHQVFYKKYRMDWQTYAAAGQMQKIRLNLTGIEVNQVNLVTEDDTEEQKADKDDVLGEVTPTSIIKVMNKGHAVQACYFVSADGGQLELPYDQDGDYAPKRHHKEGKIVTADLKLEISIDRAQAKPRLTCRLVSFEITNHMPQHVSLVEPMPAPSARDSGQPPESPSVGQGAPKIGH